MDHSPIRYTLAALLTSLLACPLVLAQQDSSPKNIISRLPGTCVPGVYYYLSSTVGNNHEGAYICNGDGRTFMSITGSGAGGSASLTRKFFGTGAPAGVAGNLPGDIYFADNNEAYFCAATFGTVAPACTSVASNNWVLMNGGGSGGGAGTITVVGGGDLTSTECATGGGSQTIQTPSANCTVDASGNMRVNSMSAGSTPPTTTGSGIMGLQESTGQSCGAGCDALIADAGTHTFKLTLNGATAGSVLSTTQGKAVSATTADAATALSGTPSTCSSGEAPQGILSNGNATGCQSVGGGGGGSFDPLDASTSWWRDDFNNLNQWYSSILGGGGSINYSNAADNNHPFGTDLLAGASPGSQTALLLAWPNGVSTNFYSLGAWKMRWIIKPGSLTSTLIQLGMAFNASYYIYLTYSSAIGPNWQGQLDNNGTITSVDLGVAASTGAFANLVMRGDATGKLYFSVNGGSEVTICPSGCTATATNPFGGGTSITIQGGVTSLASAATGVTFDFFGYSAAATR